MDHFVNDLMGKMKITLKTLFASAKTIWQRTQVRDSAIECEKELTAGIISYLDKIEIKSDKIYAQANAVYRDKRDEKMTRFQLAQQFREMRDEMKNSHITQIRTEDQ